MTSLIFASVNHVAHVEPCDDAEEGVGGHGSFALTKESAITKMTNPDDYEFTK
jgi:hypothetical protein